MLEGETQFDENGDIVTEASVWARSIEIYQDDLKRDAENRKKNPDEIGAILEGHLISVILGDDVNVFNNIYAKPVNIPMFASLAKNNLLYRLDFESTSPYMHDKELIARLKLLRGQLTALKWSEGENYKTAYKMWKELKSWLSDRVYIDVEVDKPEEAHEIQNQIRHRSFYEYEKFAWETRKIPNDPEPKLYIGPLKKS